MAEMTPRERVMTALRHEEPDRVPLDFGSGTSTTLLEETYDALKRYMGISAPTRIWNKAFRLAALDEEAMVRLGSDFRSVSLRSPKNWSPPLSEPGTFVDVWNIKRRRVDYAGGYYWELMEHPLAHATISDLDSYPWPDPDDPGWFAGLAEDVKNLYQNTQYAIVGDFVFKGFWEIGYFIRGLEQSLFDILKNKDFWHAFMTRMLEVNTAFAEKFLKVAGAYIAVIRTSDDLATQSGPMMSPKTYREMIMPYQKRLNEVIKKHTEAKIFYHCCGDITTLVPHLIEAGVEALNPFQVGAIADPAGIKAQYGHKMSFWGGVDTQRVLPHGTPEDVREEVKLRIRQLGHGGGFVAAAVHNIQPDVPPENIIAMSEAVREFGKYPLQ